MATPAIEDGQYKAIGGFYAAQRATTHGATSNQGLSQVGHLTVTSRR